MNRVRYINPAGIKRRFWVVFHDGQAVSYWRYKWLRSGFKHCFIMTELGQTARVVSLMNPLWNGIWLDHEDGEMPNVLSKLAKSAERFRVVDITVPYPDRLVWPGPYYCVPFVKTLLGISDARVWTPYQLYRKLIAMGGQEVALA